MCGVGISGGLQPWGGGELAPVGVGGEHAVGEGETGLPPHRLESVSLPGAHGRNQSHYRGGRTLRISKHTKRFLTFLNILILNDRNTLAGESWAIPHSA